MKKTISLLLTSILLFGIFVMPSAAVEPCEWGYNVLSESDKTAELTCYYGNDTEVIFPEYIDGYKMVAVADYAFNYDDIWCNDIKELSSTLEITKLTIPDTYVRLGDSSLCGLIALESVELPDSLEYIGLNVFSGSRYFFNLRDESVTTGRKVVYDGQYCINAIQGHYEYAETHCVAPGTKLIAAGAFFNARDLKRVYIPEGVEYINSGAFVWCNELEIVFIPSTVKRLEAYTFIANNSYFGIVIPATVTSIDDNFIGEGLADRLPNTIKIYGISGSEAERYANSKGITFVSLRDALGDIDGDCILSANDYAMIKNIVACISSLCIQQFIPADVNLDGTIDAFDAICIDILMNS